MPIVENVTVWEIGQHNALKNEKIQGYSSDEITILTVSGCLCSNLQHDVYVRYRGPT